LFLAAASSSCCFRHAYTGSWHWTPLADNNIAWTASLASTWPGIRYAKEMRFPAPYGTKTLYSDTSLLTTCYQKKDLLLFWKEKKITPIIQRWCVISARSPFMKHVGPRDRTCTGKRGK
jgi:hypothetical protein